MPLRHVARNGDTARLETCATSACRQLACFQLCLAGWSATGYRSHCSRRGPAIIDTLAVPNPARGGSVCRKHPRTTHPCVSILPACCARRTRTSCSTMWSRTSRRKRAASDRKACPIQRGRSSSTCGSRNGTFLNSAAMPITFRRTSPAATGPTATHRRMTPPGIDRWRRSAGIFKRWRTWSGTRRSIFMPRFRMATGKPSCGRQCLWPITTPITWGSWC